MSITKYLTLVFSIFFLFILITPTLLLLNPGQEVSVLVMSLDEETEKKDVEDIKNLTEVTFNENNNHNAYLYVATKSISSSIYSRNLIKIHLENTSPPPEFL